MTEADIRRVARHLYEQGCDREDLLVLADALDELGRPRIATRLRHHAATKEHCSEPRSCYHLGSLGSVKETYNWMWD